MDSTDWIMWAVFTGLSLRSFLHFSKVKKEMNKRERVFGLGWLGFFFVLFLPWAIREAERDYIREQKNNRQGAQ